MSKTVILFESHSMFAAREIMEQLTAAKWEVALFDVNKTNFAKHFYFRFKEQAWSNAANIIQILGLPDKLVKWAQIKAIKPRLPSVLSQLRLFQPPIVIATSRKTSLIMSYLKSKQLYRGRLVIMLPGYYADPGLVMPETDLYLCNTERQAETLKQYQIDSSRVAIIKPPLSKEFFETQDREIAASQLGLLTTMPIVILIAEILGPNVLRESFLKMIRSSNSFQIVAICGNNNSLKEVLEKITVPVRHPVKVFSQFKDLPLLMSAASVIVGPLSPFYLARAAAKRLPMVLTDSESMPTGRDFRFLIEQNVVVYGRIPAEVLFLIESLFEGRKLTNLNAAHDILALPKNSLFLADALNAIMPNQSQLMVKNYQDKSKTNQ